MAARACGEPGTAALQQLPPIPWTSRLLPQRAGTSHGHCQGLFVSRKAWDVFLTRAEFIFIHE